MHSRAEGGLNAAVQRTITGGLKMTVSASLTATRTTSGAGPFVGGADALDDVRMSFTVHGAPADLHIESTLTGQNTFVEQFDSGPPGAVPSGTTDATLEPGHNYTFTLQCNARATFSNPSRGCTQDVTVEVEPQAP
jgi:hypothetical protein